MKGITDVYESALKLLVPREVDETYAAVVNEGMKLVGAKHGSIFVPDNNKLKRIYTSTKRLYKVTPRKNGWTYKVYNTRTAVLRSGEELAKDHEEFKKNAVGADILIPLTYGHIAIGTLSVMSAPSVKWSDDELNILKAFGPIATLAIRNAHLNNELRNTLQIRDFFISMAAHELKTPITSIHLYSQVIEKDVEAGKVPKFKTVGTLSRETNRLHRLVNELMDVAYIQQGKLRYEMKKMDLIELLKEIVVSYRKEYPKYIFKLRIDDKKKSLFVYGDHDKLRQVFSNIINNSIKFSDEGSKIGVTIYNHKNFIIVKIKDKGIGISEDELPHVFDRYYRGGKVKTSKGGIGLGLSLVKSIVEAHDGKVWIQSKKSKGTTVIVEFLEYSNINDRGTSRKASSRRSRKN